MCAHRSKESINRDCEGKTKFVARCHVDPKSCVALSDTEKKAIGKTDNFKTSPMRQARNADIDPVGEPDSFPATRTLIRETSTKSAAAIFLFRRLFY
jgi:hypothetical protein